MKIPESFKKLLKYFPILKESNFAQRYFVDENVAQTEKARERIQKYQESLIRKFIKFSKRSYEGTNPKLRSTREATEKEKKYYKKWTTGFWLPTRLTLRIRAIELGTPTLKANLLRDRGARIGEKTLFTLGNFIDPLFTREIEIGENTIVQMGASILCHEFKDGNPNLDNLRVGSVKIGNSVFLTPGSILAPGVTVGDHSYVGPGIHCHNIPANHVAFGLPDKLQIPFTENMKKMIEGERNVEELPAQLHDFREYIPMFKKGTYNAVTTLLLELQRAKMPQEWRHFLLGLAGVKVHPGARIENNVFFDPWHPDRIKIDEGAHVKQHSVIITHESISPDSSVRLGDVEIGKNALIEVGAGILPGTKIGENAEVLPYSAAVVDVEPNTQVVGMPAVKEGDTFTIENFAAQHFGYSATIWDEIQAYKKKEEESRKRKMSE